MPVAHKAVIFYYLYHSFIYGLAYENAQLIAHLFILPSRTFSHSTKRPSGLMVQQSRIPQRDRAKSSPREGGGVTPYNDLYGEAPPERVPFSGFKYKKG